MRGALIAGMMLVASSRPVRAAGAAFAGDGKTVYAVEDGKIRVIRTDTGELAEMVPKGVVKPQAICRADGGAFYLVTEKALWRWTAENVPATLVEEAKKGRSFGDVACNPDTGEVLIVGTVPDHQGDAKCRLWYRPDGRTAFAGVWLRHLGDATIKAPEFLPDGTLLFSAEGDLWHGIPGALPPESGGPARADLTAYRYAPLAERFTYSGSPAEYGVRDIAYGAGHVYVQLGRIGGSGSLRTLILDAPAMDKDHKGFGLHNGIKDAIRVLTTVKVIQEFGGFSQLCASPGRDKVYMADGQTRFLADSDDENGEPVAFRIGDKILHPE